jgi:hypothetical protein
LGINVFTFPLAKSTSHVMFVFNEHKFPFMNSNPSRPSTPSPIPSSVFVPLVAPSNIPNSQHHDNTPSLPFLESSPSASYPTDNDTTHALIPLVSQTDSESTAPTRVHAMTTRSQNLIFKPSKFNDGRVKYPTPQALMASLAL